MPPREFLSDKISQALSRSSRPLEAAQLAVRFGRRVGQISDCLKKMESRGQAKRVEGDGKASFWEAVDAS